MVFKQHLGLLAWHGIAPSQQAALRYCASKPNVLFSLLVLALFLLHMAVFLSCC